MHTRPQLIDVLVSEARLIADGTLALTLTAANGAALPAATPGAHIIVHAGDLSRPYSLLRASAQPRAYDIAVQLSPRAEGLSHRLHAQAKAGTPLRIEAPHNSFGFVHDAAHSVFFAGGIGVTPILAMVRAAARSSLTWNLHYFARSPALAPFATELADYSNASLYFDKATRPSLEKLVAEAPDDAHLYCCGPARMLSAFRAAVQDRPPQLIHEESFDGLPAAATDSPFVVELNRSGRTLEVPSGQSLLQTLLAAGVRVDFSCRQGFCGTCEIKVLSGAPDHRDTVLSDQERQQGATMMACCSRSLSPKLLIDL